MNNTTTTSIPNTTTEDIVNYVSFGVFTPAFMAAFFDVIYAGVYPILLSFGIFGNILTLFVLGKETPKTSTLCLLLALTSADLCYLLVYTYYAIIVDLQLFTNLDVKYLVSKQFLTLRWAQLPIRCSKVVTMLIVSERVFAVWLPLRVRSIWTTKRSVYIITMSVVCIIGLTSPTLTPYTVQGVENIENLNTFALVLREMRLYQSEFETFHVVTSVVFNILPVFIVIVGNALIIVGIRRRTPSLKNIAQENRIQKENKVTKTLLVISFVYFFLSVPYDILYLVMILDMENSIVSLNNNTARFFIFNAYVLVLINSSVNFIVYVSTNKTYREKYRSVLCRCKRWSDEDSVVTASTPSAAQSVDTLNESVASSHKELSLSVISNRQ